MTTVLITGGAGFIGSNIALEMCGEYDVRILDNLLTGSRDNIRPFRDKLEFIKGDIRNIKTLRKACKDVDFILHQAALPSVTRSVKNPLLANNININGTLNVLIAARDSDVRKVVYASSSSIYGETPTLPKKEDMLPAPISPYAVSKLACEHYCMAFQKVYGLKTISLRYFNVFGPRQDPASEYAAVIPRFINLMLRNKRPTVFGDGSQTRDFTYVKNVVRANILAMKSKETGIYNIACGKRTSVNELVKKLNALMGKHIKPVYKKPRRGDILHSLASISKARKVLGYSVKYDIKKGLRETIGWFRRGE